MSDQDEERFSLDECLDDFYLVVLWSSDKDGPTNAPSYCNGCIVQIVAKFNPFKNKKTLPVGTPRKYAPDLGHFTKLFIVGVDRETRRVCFVSDPSKGTWEEAEEYLIEIRNNPQFISDLVKNQCETSPTASPNLYIDLVHDTLYGRGGIFDL